MTAAKKKPSAALALVSKVVSLPGAVVDRTALHINPKATDKELGELGTALVNIDGARSWWLGDYGVFLRARKLAELKKANPDVDPEELRTRGTHYLAEKAEALGIDPGSWSNCVAVAQFFAMPYRNGNPGIFFSHHVVAMNAAGGVEADPKKAVLWLLRAEENKWSVSKLREAVNKSLQTQHPPETPPEENDFAPLDEADKWAHQHIVDQLDSATARKLIVRFAEVIKFIDRLKAAASA